MSNSKNSKVADIKREILIAMQAATMYSSRGGGFILASLGVFLVSGLHMFLAFTVVTPFEVGSAMYYISCIAGAIFLSGALLYFVSRTTDDNKTAKDAVVMFTWFEIFLGLVFYFDKLVYKPLHNGAQWADLNYTGLLMGIGLAVFIPLAIKQYSSQVRALDPLEGEKHNLSATDLLKIKEDINDMIEKRLRDYTLNYDMLYIELDKLNERVFGIQEFVMDFIRTEFEDLYVQISKAQDSATDANIMAACAVETSNDVYEWMCDYNRLEQHTDATEVLEQFISELSTLQTTFEMKMEDVVEQLSTEKIKEAAIILKEIGVSQRTVLQAHTKQLGKKLTNKADSIVEIVTEKSTAKATNQIAESLESMTDDLIDKDDITQKVLAKIESMDISSHQISGVKRSIKSIQEQLKELDRIKSVLADTVRYGANEMSVAVDRDGTFETRNFVIELREKKE